jgi:hypothetical protein
MRAVPAAAAVMAEVAEAMGAPEADGRVHQRDGSETTGGARKGPIRCLFALGQILSTPGALAACAPVYMEQCLARHLGGDWGVVCADDHQGRRLATVRWSAGIAFSRPSGSAPMTTGITSPLTSWHR